MRVRVGGFLAVGLLLAIAALCPALLAQEEVNPYAAFEWQTGPAIGALGDIATIGVPEGFAFAGADDTRTFLELNGNPASGDELGLLIPTDEESGWFVVFEFSSVGYVKDDEKDELDHDALLESIREGNEHGNEIRRERGWPTLEIDGWETPPHYDLQTNNLTWAIRGHTSIDDSAVINHSTRLLGRRGYMNVDLVIEPSEFSTTLPLYADVMSSFSYLEGSRYAEFRKGDKIATYGLAALIAGGAGALAAKSGLLSKIWKFLVLGLVALLGFFRKVFKRIFGRGETIPKEPDIVS
jgi:uncharacterized membrane-anchored protein